MGDIIKIVVVGPESTGKSTLCQQLAMHFNTQWCPEYARTFLEENGIEYTYSNLLTIAQRQLANEDEYTLQLAHQQAGQPKPLFIDTDMQVMRVWCEFVFGKCHQYILDQLKQRTYDLYLLCNIDLPWVKDEMREYPDENLRRQLFTIYHNMLSRQLTPFVIINGNNEERLNAAIGAVNKLFLLS